MSDPRCLNQSDFEAYLRGHMAAPRLSEIDEHLETCDRCEATVRALERDPKFGLEALGCNSPPVVPSPEPTALDVDLRERLKRIPDQAVASTTDETADTSVPTSLVGQRLRQYELLELIGRGGMGCVYRARQINADRIVALKTIRAGQFADSEEIERFQTEAKAAASLRHNHIVAVHEVGCDDVHHFYSMDLIQGQSLAECLKESGGPLDPREAATLMAPVADAIHFANAKGVIHRDLKPANILLDYAGVPKITDFGLAKRLHFDSSLTMTGLVMGTPSYMAPEQAAGHSHEVDATTDVYGLGAVLYHLLTGRPPFLAATSSDTIQLVKFAEPVSPRQHNPALPRDLETICLKCLQKERGRRYSSAEFVAEDLRAWLDGRPISARPVTRLERGYRWCRRNPLVASLSGGLIALSVASVVVLSISNASLRQAQKRDEKSFRQAVQTVDDLLTRVSEETLLNQAGLQPVRADLLKLARDHYQSFLTQRRDEPGLADLLAKADYRCGQIEGMLSSSDDALKEYRLAESNQRQLYKEVVTAERAMALSDTLNAEASIHSKEKRIQDAQHLIEETVALRRRAVLLEPTALEYQRKLASSLMNLGIVHKKNLQLEQARDLLTEAQDIRASLMRNAGSNNVLLLRDMGMGHYNLGTLTDATSEQRIEQLTLARHCYAVVLAIRRDDLEIRDLFATCCEIEAVVLNNRASESKKRDDYEAAEKCYAEAQVHFTELSRANPKVHKYQAAVGRVELSQGGLALERRDYERAIAILNSSVQTFKKLLPFGVPAYQDDHDTARLILDVAQVVSQREQAVELAHQGSPHEETCKLLWESRQSLLALLDQSETLGHEFAIKKVREHLTATDTQIAEFQCPDLP